MDLFLLFLIFVTGASLGSFLSVVLHRFQKKEQGIFLGRSKCPSCKKNLESKDLIPLISFMILRGKCAYCKTKINPAYFFLELSMGLLAILFYLKFPFMMENVLLWGNILLFLLHLVYSLLLLGIFFYDLRHMQIPDVLLFPLIGLTFIGSILISGMNFLNMMIALGIIMLFLGGQIVLSKGKWLGSGDLYLGISMAFLLGWEKLLVAIVITYGIGAAISLMLLFNKKINAKAKIPFAPFMVLGTFSSIFLGEKILLWYLNFLNF